MAKLEELDHSTGKIKKSMSHGSTPFFVFLDYLLFLIFVGFLFFIIFKMDTHVAYIGFHERSCSELGRAGKRHYDHILA